MNCNNFPSVSPEAVHRQIQFRPPFGLGFRSGFLKVVETSSSLSLFPSSSPSNSIRRTSPTPSRFLYLDGGSRGWTLVRNSSRRKDPSGGGISVAASFSEGRKGESYLPWDRKPFEVLSGGKISYLDEQDIVTLLDPPKVLIPLDSASYNPARYLWKKIGDIPEERRYRLLYLLKPRLISRLWELAGTRYQDAKLVKQSASNLLSMADTTNPPEFWSCRTSGGPLPIAWINDFKKVIFHCKNEGTYGRILMDSFSPLYFTVTEIKEVMSTEQPCDLAYEFGDGLFDIIYFPVDFPKPAKHPWPFDDHLVIYVRHAGPGVLVAQAWQEGRELEQVPTKFCSEILMVRNYSAGGGDS